MNLERIEKYAGKKEDQELENFKEVLERSGVDDDFLFENHHALLMSCSGPKTRLTRSLSQ